MRSEPGLVPSLMGPEIVPLTPDASMVNWPVSVIASGILRFVVPKASMIGVFSMLSAEPSWILPSIPWNSMRLPGEPAASRMAFARDPGPLALSLVTRICALLSCATKQIAQKTEKIALMDNSLDDGDFKFESNAKGLLSRNFRSQLFR